MKKRKKEEERKIGEETKKRKLNTQIPTCGASMRVKAAGGRNKGAGWLSQSAFSIP